MYARVVRFNFGPDNHAKASELANDLVPQISALAGCHNVVCYGDASDGEYGLFVLWDSQKAADDAATVIGPQLSKHFAGNVKGAPDIRLFEVIQNA